jgi:hypothetical protein
MSLRYLRHILAVAVLGLMVVARPAMPQELTFLSGIDDLPLTPGLQENTELTLIFDSAEGRFVEAYAVGNVTEMAVSEFYRQSLPQLGWLHDGMATFQRDGEVLVILPSPSTGSGYTTTVRFALSPQNSN